jgi:hypothetical protein
VFNFKLLGIDFSLDLSSMPDLNFRKKIIDVSKILKNWQQIFRPEALQKFSKQIRVSLSDVSQPSSTRNVSSAY